MAVQVHDQQFGINGHEKSIAIFRRAHVENSTALINHAEGKPVDHERPPYDPSHPDNKWPLMVHHAEKGELTVGRSLVGVEDPMTRNKITAANEKALAAAVASGYRAEPYPKPQVVVLDPATEKAELKRKNDELQGQITALTDLFNKAIAAKPADAPKP